MLKSISIENRNQGDIVSMAHEENMETAYFGHTGACIRITCAYLRNVVKSNS